MNLIPRACSHLKSWSEGFSTKSGFWIMSGFCRLRGRKRSRSQEDRWLPPFHATRQAVPPPSMPSGGSPGRSRVAHPGFRQEPHDGLLCRKLSWNLKWKSDPRGPFGPERSGRPAFRCLLPLPDALRQTPKQAGNRAELREFLSVPSGGIVFTTIQKFFPEERATPTRCSPTGETSSSSRMKLIGASTTSSTVSRST